MPIECNVLDAGARYGLHPTWQPVQDIINFYLFEADIVETERLKEKYINSENIKIYFNALFSEDTTLVFNERRHKALNSIYDTNDQLLNRDGYKTEEHSNQRSYSVEANKIDTLFPNIPIHFLKLDTEGAELDILKGSKQQILQSILGIRAEVPFAPILKDAPTFGDIHNHLIDAGFELLNLDYDGRGSSNSPFTEPNKYGKLMSTDAVWVVPTEKIFSGDYDSVEETVIRYSMFLMLNNATDVAVDVLLKAVRDFNVSFRNYSEDPLFKSLHKRVALLFKSIGYIPSVDEKLLSETYELIFQKEFPRLNQFYENELFS